MDTVETKPKQCEAFFLQPNLKSFSKTQNFKIIQENINVLLEPGWRRIIENDGTIVLVKKGESLDIQCFDFLVSKLQVFSSSNTIASNNEACKTSDDSCRCFKTFSLLKNTLNSASTEQWVCFWICQEKTYLSIGDEQTSIPAEDFHQLQTLVSKLIKLNNDASNIVNTRVPLGETENKVKTVITSHIISQEDFFKESNEIVHQKCKAMKQLNTLLFKLCGSLEDDQNSPNKDEPSDVSSEATSRNNDDLHALQQAGGSVPLLTLLQCIIVRLTSSNWKELRRYVARDIPLRVLANIPDNIEFFQELENRKKIQIGNTEYIRSGFYEIGRVDLVHLLDCIQEGDYSLLTAERRRRNNGSNLEGGASSYLRRMHELTVVERRERVATDGLMARSPNVAGDTNEPRDRPLQRRYRNEPQRTAPSTPFPVQEHTAANIRGQSQTSANISNNEEDQSNQNTNAEGSNSQSAGSEGASTQGESTNDTHPRGKPSVLIPPEGGNVEGASSRGQNPEDTRTWVMSREFSCEHYDRYCEVKFACCENFWPCHRCHNSNSKCNEKKLRSRDIKKLKCRRCGKIQDFPRNSQHCVECNLKFAEYFCAICQHLTGTQNNPFHCEKCGICREHEDRSFHCDDCAVRLDVNRRGNQKCRAGSAHDNSLRVKKCNRDKKVFTTHVHSEDETLSSDNPSTSLKSEHPSSSNGASNDCQNPSTSNKIKHPPTSNGDSNIQHPQTSIESTIHPTSRGPSIPFPPSLQSPIERTDSSTTVAGEAGSFEGADAVPTTREEPTNRTHNARSQQNFVNEAIPLSRYRIQIFRANSGNSSRSNGQAIALEEPLEPRPSNRFSYLAERGIPSALDGEEHGDNIPIILANSFGASLQSLDD